MPPTVILKGKAAIDLWQQGLDAWNKWVAQNPHADVDFSDADFSTYDTVSFEGFHFPNGDISFGAATFGDGNVSFDYATFGEGNVFFCKATFGNGSVSFDSAEFRFKATMLNRNAIDFKIVNFEFVDFGDSHVSFRSAIFSKYNVNFKNIIFGNGFVDFENTKFGNGNVDFSNTKFGNADVNFVKTLFGNGELNFSSVIFGEGNLCFDEAKFGNGDIYFIGTNFHCTDVQFIKTTFGLGGIYFAFANFSGRFIFGNCKNTDAIKALSFQDCHFKSTVSIKAALTCVPDLCGTVVSAHVDLDNLHISPNTLSVEDAGKYRRLKELAEQNRDHEAALRFFAAERRCARWASGPEGRKSILSRAKILPELTYDELSNYGRPVLYLLGLIAVTGILYWRQADYTYFLSAFKIALSDSIPFTPLVRQIGPETDTVLATATYAWRVLHRASSFILLFLIGLGLRNRLRL